MTWAGRIRHRWHMAGVLARAEDAGQVVMVVPGWMAAEVSREVWLRKVQHASDKWAAKVQDIPPTQWQDAVANIGRHRLPKPRDKR